MALSQEDKQEVVTIIQEVFQNFNRSDRFTFEKKIQILNGRNIELGGDEGTKFGTAVDQKLGLYGTTPVVQGSTITDPTGGGTQDAEARTAINALIDRLQDIGIIA